MKAKQKIIRKNQVWLRWYDLEVQRDILKKYKVKTFKKLVVRYFEKKFDISLNKWDYFNKDILSNQQDGKTQ